MARAAKAVPRPASVATAGGFLPADKPRVFTAPTSHKCSAAARSTCCRDFRGSVYPVGRLDAESPRAAAAHQRLVS